MNVEAIKDPYELAVGDRVIFAITYERGQIDSIEDGWAFWIADDGSAHLTKIDCLLKERRR